MRYFCWRVLQKTVSDLMKHLLSLCFLDQHAKIILSSNALSNILMHCLLNSGCEVAVIRLVQKLSTLPKNGILILSSHFDLQSLMKNVGKELKQRRYAFPLSLNQPKKLIKLWEMRSYLLQLGRILEFMMINLAIMYVIWVYLYAKFLIAHYQKKYIF
jgi:hypothetical protein